MSNSNNKIYAGIDAGGTTFKCVIATADAQILYSQRFPTTQPEETIRSCVGFFKDMQQMHDLEFEGLGIAAFGPLDIDEASDTYGSILNTPKPYWSNVNLKKEFEEKLGLKTIVNTDVNSAIAAELWWGAAQNCRRAAYVTIGTGIGVGLVQDGIFMGSPLHPEMGHIRVQRHIDDQDYKGYCRFHNDCLEGLACAPAFEERYGSAKELPTNHKGWDIEAYYLAQICLNLTLTFRPERIVLGGGLMLAAQFLPKIQKQYEALLGDYLRGNVPQASHLIRTPLLGDNAGMLGAIAIQLE
ncbi:ROK family protein [Hirschia baltica]|uniref:ROK family protein n=1 Tax=Hirschia baltica (strain ATCC 49814 / DSM 5838 / IFAM 1418) TaxID=582402 RepID=C6XS23_HIRBI|nr:ROK family protein [Hirschia baltica]ACT60864.1 ROK family protein [Hirschia baltica ATCC 49814]